MGTSFALGASTALMSIPTESGVTIPTVSTSPPLPHSMTPMTEQTYAPWHSVQATDQKPIPPLVYHSTTSVSGGTTVHTYRDAEGWLWDYPGKILVGFDESQPTGG